MQTPNNSIQKRIFLDCTATLFSGFNTGIQRVVRNIISRKALVESDYGVEVVPIVGVFGNFYEVPVEVILNAKPITASIGTLVRTAFDKAKRVIIKKIPWPKVLLPMLEKVLGWIEWVLKSVFWIIKYLRVMKTVYGQKCPRAYIRSQDTVVLLDAFWQFDLSSSLKKENPLRVVTVMYDLVPVNHPDCVEDVNRGLFLRALPWALSVTNRFLSISQDVSDQLQSYCHDRNIKNKQFEHFILGSDFAPRTGSDDLGIEWQGVFENSPVWLMVGTIEPRKNHRFALDAFDLLWQQGANDKLLIVGRIGWKCDQLIDRILKHPEFNKRLYLKWHVTDNELQTVYKKSEGLIFSSFAEGFGLPLVEAMASQIKIVCSDIPIFREVGGSYPTYFSLANPQNLVEAVNLMRQRPAPPPVKWPSWDDSARDFAEKVLKK